MKQADRVGLTKALDKAPQDVQSVSQLIPIDTAASMNSFDAKYSWAGIHHERSTTLVWIQRQQQKTCTSSCIHSWIYRMWVEPLLEQQPLAVVTVITRVTFAAVTVSMDTAVATPNRHYIKPK